MKLTKSEAISEARTLANKDEQAAKMTVEQLINTPYAERTTMAHALANRAFVAKSFSDVPERFRGDWFNTYVECVSKNWGWKLKNLENLRNEFRKACKGITTKEASAKVIELLESMHIRRARIGDYSGVSVNVERAWGVSADLYIRFEQDGERLSNPDDPSQSAWKYCVTTSISWSSTGRTIAEATASINLYKELIDAACEVESVMRGERIVSTYGIPEPVAQVANADATV